MTRRPKIHPQYKINLSGINFRERWNVVSHATKEELELYIDNEKFQINNKRNQFENYWEWKVITSVPKAQNIQLRKLWRIRFADSFEFDKLYTVTKSIPRYSQRVGTPGCDGVLRPYEIDRERIYRLNYDDVLVLNHRDELGTVYFSNIKDIGSKYTYAFMRDSALLSSLELVKA